MLSSYRCRVEGGKQGALEESVDVGGFGYPALVALNSRKGKYSPLKGSFGKVSGEYGSGGGGEVISDHGLT